MAAWASHSDAHIRQASAQAISWASISIGLGSVSRETTLLVVRDANDEDGDIWLRIQLPIWPNGQAGWVAASDVRLTEACVRARRAGASARVAGRGTRLDQPGVRGALRVYGEQRDKSFHDAPPGSIRVSSGLVLAAKTFGADSLGG